MASLLASAHVLLLRIVRALHMLVISGLVVTACARADLHWFAPGFLVLVARSITLTVLYPMASVSVNREGRFTC